MLAVAVINLFTFRRDHGAGSSCRLSKNCQIPLRRGNLKFDCVSKYPFRAFSPITSTEFHSILKELIHRGIQNTASRSLDQESSPEGQSRCSGGRHGTGSGECHISSGAEVYPASPVQLVRRSCPA